MKEKTEVNIIDFKLIDAYSVLCLSKEQKENTIEELLLEVKVPEKYKREVAIKVAEKRIDILEENEKDGNEDFGK